MSLGEKLTAFAAGLTLCVAILICWLCDFAVWCVIGDEGAPPP